MSRARLAMPVPKREKRTVRITANLENPLAEALYRLMQEDNASASTVIQKVLKRDPSVRILLQEIGPREGRS